MNAIDAIDPVTLVVVQNGLQQVDAGTPPEARRP